MVCKIIKKGLILTVGGEPFRISVRGQLFEFEMHWLGPMPVTRTGSERRLGNRHPFWEAVSWWNEQGREKDAAGLCVWSVPPPPKLKHLGGRHYLLIHGEPEPVAGEEE